MRDIRQDVERRLGTTILQDISEYEADITRTYAVNDFAHKNLILPVFLQPSLLRESNVKDFFSDKIADCLSSIISEIPMR